ncbi:hypothetical protein BDF20DRAFT_913589 [Mycotypha africana]|uniref:uncharacterized protein n=1 Tax=Mycotypha africana TaxID=64632 RepID=UPI0023010673|nr:uncharacterized protein BDF20DRAFT_913589 [Mycotypha africana]KAI8977240.1 hypothetical protein BDF20DRAFT_913589 [Mycotypha africana]
MGYHPFKGQNTLTSKKRDNNITDNDTASEFADALSPSDMDMNRDFNNIEEDLDDNNESIRVHLKQPQVIVHDNSSDEDQDDESNDKDIVYGNAEENRAALNESYVDDTKKNQQQQQQQGKQQQQDEIEEEWQMDAATKKYHDMYNSEIKHTISWFTDRAGKDQRTSHERLLDCLQKDDNELFKYLYDLETSPFTKKQMLYNEIVKYFENQGIRYRRVGSVRSHIDTFFLDNYNAVLKSYKDYCKLCEQSKDSKKIDTRKRTFNEYMKKRCPDFYLILDLTGDSKRVHTPNSSTLVSNNKTRTSAPLHPVVAIDTLESHNATGASKSFKTREDQQQQRRVRSQSPLQQQQQYNPFDNNSTLTEDNNDIRRQSLHERQLALKERELAYKERKLAFRECEDSRRHKRAKTRRLELQNLEMEHRLLTASRQ